MPTGVGFPNTNDKIYGLNFAQQSKSIGVKNKFEKNISTNIAHQFESNSDRFLSQAELFVLTKECLIRRLVHQNIQTIVDGEYIRFKKEGNQIGVIYKLSNGNRMKVSFNLALQAIADEFESSISTKLIVNKTQYYDRIEFTFYPNLTQAEVNVLKEPIDPIKGQIVIVQGEYVVVGKQDAVHLVSTFGIDSCRGMIIYSPDKEIAAVTHSDTEYADISLIEKMRTDLVAAGADPAKLKFFGTSNIDPDKRQFIINKLFLGSTYEVPSAFTFDCVTGEILPFDIKSMPSSIEFHQRLEKETSIRMKYNIPYIRKFIK